MEKWVTHHIDNNFRYLSRPSAVSLGRKYHINLLPVPLLLHLFRGSPLMTAGGAILCFGVYSLATTSRHNRCMVFFVVVHIFNTGVHKSIIWIPSHKTTNSRIKVHIFNDNWIITPNLWSNSICKSLYYIYICMCVCVCIYIYIYIYIYVYGVRHYK